MNELVDIIRSGKDTAIINELITRHLGDREHELLPEGVSERVFAKLHFEQTPAPKSSRLRRMPPLLKIAVAAAVIIALTVGVYYIKPASAPHFALEEKDVPPGGNRATLVLADGRELVLTDLQVGDVADEDGIVIKKTADGMLEYQSGVSGGNGMNVIKTPKGGQYCVVLPDGSKVWLNAASTITYAASFGKRERTVKLSGEAYFEVLPQKHNGKSVPFFVETAGQKIEVLGTRFNVNAYDDGNGIKTTLLEGKVKVMTGEDAVILKPSQEFSLRSDGASTQQVDVDVAIDWKNGDFIFAEEDIRSVMRKVARWYDVEVIYEDEAGAPREHISGQISRNRNLSEVLRMLELSGNMRFRIQNSGIHVYSNQ